MKKGKAAIAGVAVAAWGCFIFRNSLKPKPASAAQSAAMSQWLAKLMGFFGIDATESATVIVRKCAHIFEFFVLALLLYALFRLLGKRATTATAISAAVSFCAAATDETIQIFSSRGPSVRDVLIDCIGIALAMCVIFIQKNKGTE